MKRWWHTELSDMAEWPDKLQWLAWLLLAILVLVTGYVWRIEPQRQQLEANRREASGLTETLQTLPQVRAGLVAAQGDYGRQGQRYDALLRQLPARHDLAPLLAQISRLGMQYRITLTRMEWQAAEEEETLIRIPLLLEATAEYPALQSFLHAVARLPFVIQFEDVRWQRSDPQHSELQFHARGYTYLIRPGETDDD